ncbi:MAG: hypothetical protein IAE81_07440 [Caldilineaceae bacterium]|jgi:hypothetical protein|nr:hypothetical protein [Caldilineaceae bacterium]
MPRLSVWFARAALSYLTLGFTFGALMLANKGIPLHPLLWRLLPAHIEFLLFGWTVQLAFGVAFWILPRWQTQRGDLRPAWAAFILLNGGIWLVVLAGWSNGSAWWLAVGRLLEAAAMAAFALHAWPRVKPWVEESK